MENSKYTFAIDEPEEETNQDNEWLRALMNNRPLVKPVHAGRKIVRSPMVSTRQIRGIRYGK